MRKLRWMNYFRLFRIMWLWVLMGALSCETMSSDGISVPKDLRCQTSCAEVNHDKNTYTSIDCSERKDRKKHPCRLIKTFSPRADASKEDREFCSIQPPIVMEKTDACPFSEEEDKTPTKKSTSKKKSEPEPEQKKDEPVDPMEAENGGG